MQKLKYIVLLFVFFLSFSGQIYATESNSIIPDGNYLREINGVYYGKKQLDEAKVDASDLYSNSKISMKYYYKYDFDEFIDRMQDSYYKEYIYQSLYYSIKFEDTQEVTWVTDFLWWNMNYTWISQNNELRIYFDSFYNQITDINSSIVTQEWKYENDSYKFTPEIIHISKWSEIIDINFQFYLPKIMIENQEEMGILLPDDNTQVVVNFEHQTGSNITDNTFYKYIGNENNILENTNAIFRLDVTNKWYDGQRLNFIFKGAYDIFLLYEKGKNIFIKSACNTDERDYFSWSKNYYSNEIQSWDGYDRAQYITQLDLEFTKYQNWTGVIVEIPYTYTFDGYDRNKLYFTDSPLGLYTYKIKNLKSTYSHICEKVYGITKPDNFDGINLVLENEKKIFFQDKIYSYTDDVFQIFPPERGELWQRTSVSSWNFDFSWEYRNFSFIKKFDVTLMNSQKENILSLGCIAPENMTEEKIIENIDKEYYISNQLDACKEDISEWLTNYFGSGAKVEFPWISLKYEDIFWVTESVFSRFEFMPENIPYITLKADSFDENGEYFYFDTYNIWYDDIFEVSLIDNDNNEISIPVTPSWDESYFDRDNGNELFIKKAQSFKKITIKVNGDIIFQKDFVLEQEAFQTPELNHKYKESLAKSYSVDHLFSEKIWDNEDILFGRKIYIKKLNNEFSDSIGYDIQLSLTGTLLWDIDTSKLYICSQEVIDFSTLWVNLDCNNLSNLTERLEEEDILSPEEELTNNNYLPQWIVLYDMREFYIYGEHGLVSPDFQKLSIQFQITTFKVEWEY